MSNENETNMDACAAGGLSQVVKKPTRISFNSEGARVATCIDHIYVNTPEVCSIAISLPMGFSDHNLIAIVRKTKVPKPGVKIIRKRSFKHFNENLFVEDVKNANWSQVFLLHDPEKALQAFNSILMTIIDHHAPVRKFTVRNVYTPWLDDELREYLTI